MGKTRSELREIASKVLYETYILDNAKIKYDINSLIKEELEIENDFVNLIVNGVREKQKDIIDLANKYLIDCNQCKAKYCKNCGNIFEENNKCEICKKVCCNDCTNKNGNLKCIICQKKLCLECSSKCINCSNNHCKVCSKICENCKNSTCIKCYSECACGKEKYCNKCISKNEPILPHECIYFLNKNSITESKKTRSFKKIPYNINIEAKFSVFINDMSDKSFLLVGLTDNNSFEENCSDEIKNIFAVNANNGDKYCTEKGFEAFLDFENTSSISFILCSEKLDLFLIIIFLILYFIFAA